MKNAAIHMYDDIDYGIEVSPQIYEKVDEDMNRVRMFSPDSAFAILNREIDRLHFRFKTFGKRELEEEIVARTIALKGIN